MSARVPSLSILLPAYNEEQNIGAAVHAALAALDGRAGFSEVVVVDDGSSDATPVVLERLAALDPRVRVVRHATNGGYGAALRSGIRAAAGEYVFFTDADLQFDLDELSLLEPWASRYDVVVGFRADRADPWPRRLNAWGWNTLVNGLFGLDVKDVDCAFKLFHRRVLQRVEIASEGAFVNSEILVQALAAGFRIHQVPVSHFPRVAGQPTGANLRVISRAFSELGRRWRPLRGQQRRATGEARWLEGM